jgi:hypothetical protein
MTPTRIEFKQEGYAKVTITISRELIEQTRALDLTTGELFAEAIRLAVPGAFELAPHIHRGGIDGSARCQRKRHNRWSRALVWGGNALMGQLARVSKHDLRLPMVIADLPCHTDALAAE